VARFAKSRYRFSQVINKSSGHPLISERARAKMPLTLALRLPEFDRNNWRVRIHLFRSNEPNFGERKNMRDEEVVATEATEVIVTAEQATNSAVTTNGSRTKNSKKNSKKRRNSEAQPDKVDPNQMIKARFAACSRCCYFLGSYTSTHGEAELETAAINGSSGWLTLTWDQHTRNLVHKAFGVRLDVDFYHYEGRCVACYRQFVYETSETNEAIFRVQL
jgi:hypothetical protein